MTTYLSASQVDAIATDIAHAITVDHAAGHTTDVHGATVTAAGYYVGGTNGATLSFELGHVASGDLADHELLDYDTVVYMVRVFSRLHGAAILAAGHIGVWIDVDDKNQASFHLDAVERTPSRAHAILLAQLREEIAVGVSTGFEWSDFKTPRRQTKATLRPGSGDDKTPFSGPGCSGCGAPLDTEGDFAAHFTVDDSRYVNLGSCPVKDEIKLRAHYLNA